MAEPTQRIEVRLASPMEIIVSRSRRKLQRRARPGGRTANRSETLLLVQGRARGTETLSRLAEMTANRLAQAGRILLRIGRSCKRLGVVPHWCTNVFRAEGHMILPLFPAAPSLPAGGSCAIWAETAIFRAQRLEHPVSTWSRKIRTISTHLELFPPRECKSICQRPSR